MDYDILNSAITDIIDIVNNYNKTHNYKIDTCEDLVIALTGFYLAFGPEIFLKINEVLSMLEIHHTENAQENIDIKRNIRRNIIYSPQPLPETIWEMILKKPTNKFLGAKPHIIYDKVNKKDDVLTLVHELSHTLEGCTAKVINEDFETITIKMGLSNLTFEKDGGTIVSGNGLGMTELITVCIENRILKEFQSLDPSKIENNLLKDYIEKVKSPLINNYIAKSYIIMSAIFKDLIDNDQFFEIINRRYYETDQEGFKEEFDSFDERLNFKKIVGYAECLRESNIKEAMSLAPQVQAQLNILNEVTNTKSNKSILLVF